MARCTGALCHQSATQQQHRTETTSCGSTMRLWRDLEDRQACSGAGAGVLKHPCTYIFLCTLVKCICLNSALVPAPSSNTLVTCIWPHLQVVTSMCLLCVCRCLSRSSIDECMVAQDVLCFACLSTCNHCIALYAQPINAQPQRASGDVPVNQHAYIRVHVHPKRFPAVYTTDWKVWYSCTGIICISYQSPDCLRSPAQCPQFGCPPPINQKL